MKVGGERLLKEEGEWTLAQKSAPLDGGKPESSVGGKVRVKLLFHKNSSFEKY